MVSRKPKGAVNRAFFFLLFLRMRLPAKTGKSQTIAWPISYPLLKKKLSLAAYLLAVLYIQSKLPASPTRTGQRAQRNAFLPDCTQEIVMGPVPCTYVFGYSFPEGAAGHQKGVSDKPPSLQHPGGLSTLSQTVHAPVAMWEHSPPRSAPVLCDILLDNALNNDSGGAGDWRRQFPPFCPPPPVGPTNQRIVDGRRRHSITQTFEVYHCIT